MTLQKLEKLLSSRYSDSSGQRCRASPPPHIPHAMLQAGLVPCLGFAAWMRPPWCVICLISISSCKRNVDFGSLASNLSSLSVKLDIKNLHLNWAPWMNWIMFLGQVKFWGVQDKAEKDCEDCFSSAQIKQEQTTLYFPVSPSAIWPACSAGSLLEYPA